ncbi:MAG: DsrE family protein [candidate division KSB1 bacterium]|nr:DsrE family protein [candidate division KSB1 bacterium]MDZ7356701.1 DsrE family protein [candidate division KSB1 bacterium]MDZ7377351.1 DsrE family protein [candidate division KSB1 bacterium]MDZ7398611.1 DsrE family protein [candidate division KSB1 bacterium]
MRTFSVLNWSVFVVLILINLSGCQKQSSSQLSPQKDGVFVHISNGTNDPHRVLMALNMAAIMSQDRDVLVYFDIKGIEVVLKDAPDLTYSHFPSSLTQLNNLLQRGVPIYVCPGCLKAAGKTEADVMPGVMIAKKEAFFNFTKGRILTLDY